MTSSGVAAVVGNDPRLAQAMVELTSVLVPGETIEAVTVQRRIFALVRRRIVVAATTGRLIAMTRGLIGGFKPQDVRWQDLKDAKLDVGIFGADLIIEAFASADLALGGRETRLLFTGLRKEEAQQVYRICQLNEQGWREKRRERELEELRAKSGGIQIGSTGAAAPSAFAAANDDVVARLQRAKDMLEKGLISDAEFETIKAKIVSNL